jgi:hypothetical protein
VLSGASTLKVAEAPLLFKVVSPSALTALLFGKLTFRFTKGLFFDFFVDMNDSNIGFAPKDPLKGT